MTRSWTGAEFSAYVDVLLDNMNPYPQKNSVLVMDNASTHHFEGLREKIEARYVYIFGMTSLLAYRRAYRGMRLVYLPAYSPDLNPIEEGFSAMKAWIRRNRDYVLGELSEEPMCDPIAMLWEAVFVAMDSESIRGWYRDSGYLV